MQYDKLSELIHSYNQANVNYWNSISELEQYVSHEICFTDDDFVEVIDNLLVIRVREPSKSFYELKECLEKKGIKYEYEEEEYIDTINQHTFWCYEITIPLEYFLQVKKKE